MADSGNEINDGQDSVHGENNNRQLESTLARMASYFERQEDRLSRGEQTTIDVPNDVALERFQRFRPPRFNGEGGEEMAEKWIEAIEDIYCALKYTDERKVSFGEFQLEGPAKAWWRVIKEKWEMEGKPYTWSAFTEEFKKKFIPLIVRERNEEKFISLKQKTLTVTQYEIQFTKLSKYAPDMVNTEAKRRRRFLQGLNIEIQTLLVPARMDTYADVVEYAQKAEDCQAKLKEFRDSKKSGPRDWENAKGNSSQGQARRSQERLREFTQKRPSETGASTPAKRGNPRTPCQFCGRNNHREINCWRKTGQCLRCGSSEHRINDCPSSPPRTTRPTASGPTQRGNQGTKRKITVPARVYATTRNEIESETAVVEGTFTISGNSLEFI